MALDPLATAADLTIRGIDTSETLLVEAMLAAASASVRQAAGHPITRATVTIELPGHCGQWLQIPGGPVTAVAAVEIDGVAVTDYTRQIDQLYRCRGWQSQAASTVGVTATAGFAEVPADVVDLVCNLTGYALAHASKGWAQAGKVTQRRIDDYAVTYAVEEAVEAGLLELPPRTRKRLRARFGGGASMISFDR